MNHKMQLAIVAMVCAVPIAFAGSQISRKPLPVQKTPAVQTQQDQTAKGTDGFEIPGMSPTAPVESNLRAAATRKPCRVEFIASFGDPDQVSGAPTNIDKNSAYSWPTNGFPMPTTDTDIINSNHIRGFSITGYPQFKVPNVVEATLRVDVYLHMSDGLWDNDALAVWDDVATTNKATTLIWGNSYTGEFASSLTPFLTAHRGCKEQWVTFLFDLTPGSGHGVYVYGIDQFGRPDPARYYGLWKTITAATATNVLQYASNGNLHGVMEDDCPLSYAELVIKTN